MPEEQGLVGTAETLTPEETKTRLRELAAWGVDLSLVQANLERTPSERINHMLELLQLAQSLRNGYLQATGVPNDNIPEAQP